MFGYIKPVAAELKVKEYELYRAVYCGLCAALGRNATCVSRLSLSYDFVFLAVVRMALAGETGKIKKRRCIAHPTKKRAVLVGADQLDYCAKVSAVLTYHKLRDDIADSRFLKKIGAYLLLPAASMMRKKAAPDASLDALIAEKLVELSSLESEKCASVDRAAEPFGELMAAVCGHGFEEGSAEARIAGEIGRHIGRFIYISDAIDDLADDIGSGSYNPFCEMYGEGAAEKLRENAGMLERALTLELMDVSAAVELMDFTAVPEYENITKNIIYLGLPELAKKLLYGDGQKTDNGENSL